MNYFIKDFNFKSEFLRNIFTLLSGSTIAQIITFLAIPVLTRIYTPQDFGFFAIYFSLATIVSTISTGRYELAIMLPRHKKDALAILKGTTRIVFVISFLCFIAITIIKNSENIFIKFINPNYFYFLPLSVLVLPSQGLHRVQIFYLVFSTTYNQQDYLLDILLVSSFS